MKRKLIYYLILVLTSSSLFSQAQITAINRNVSTNLGGFEEPILANGTFQYTPQSLPWIFGSGSGISSNGSGFTRNNPSAQEGRQVAFLQGRPTISRTFTVIRGGTFSFSFLTAQRGNNRQSIALLINNQRIALIEPTSSNYETFTSPAISLASGSHTIIFQGLNPRGGDNTAFIDDVKIHGISAWSNPSSWSTGAVPTLSSNVIIPMGVTIVLDRNVDVKSLMVNGTLQVDHSKDIELSAEYIMVHGAFIWGTESNPYLRNGVITLKGNNTTSSIMGMGTKFIGSMGGGSIDIHGQNKLSWTMLNANAIKGTSSISISEPADWRIGDEIIITSTGIETTRNGKKSETETEKRIITAMSADRRTLTLNSPLNFNHYGRLQTYSNNNQSWILDERAEVGLISRNIKIQGDLNSNAIAFGAHVMVMNGSKGNISGVEFDRVGQAGILGRYPFHWHLVGDGQGQFIKNCSVHNSFNRGITIHGTNNTLVENNVCYNIMGHAIFLEDAAETGNIINRNLVATVVKPSIEKALLPSDRFLSINRIEGPAAFWISHPTNTVTNNAAVGAGTGFWYALPDQPMNNNYGTNIRPNRAPFGTFDSNRAHACYVGFDVDFVDKRDLSEVITAHYFAPQGTIFSNFTGFKNYRAIWHRGGNVEISNFKLGDNEGLGQFVATFDALFTNGLVVGYSDNSTNGINTQSYATSIYDGNITINNCHFENFDGGNQAIFTTFGGAQKHLPANTSRISMKKCIIYDPEMTDEFSPNVSFIQDLDGSLLGSTGKWAAVGIPFIIDDKNFVQIQPNTMGYMTDLKFARIRFDFRPYKKQVLYHQFADGHMAHSKPVGDYYDVPVAVNTDRVYEFRMTEFIPPAFKMFFQQARAGEKVRYFLSALPEELIVTAAGGSIQRVSSMSALSASTVNAYFYANNEMHFNLVFNGALTLNFATRSGNEIKPIQLKSKPYLNTANKINTNVQAEHFDWGGNGVGYKEDILRNHLNNESFRNTHHRVARLGEIVDLTRSSSDPSNYFVTDIKSGEWYNYTFNITRTGVYKPKFNIATTLANNVIKIYVDDKEAATHTFGSTNGRYTEFTFPDINISQGARVIKVEALSDDIRIDWLRLDNPNIDPIISITSPANNTTFNAGTNINITTNASDPDGSIVRVEFFTGNIKIGERTAAPWNYTWSNALPGTYQLSARVHDNSGAIVTSPVLTLIVNAAQSNSNCINTTLPMANNFVLRNDWTDQSNGSSLSNTPDALQLSHRQWGRNFIWLIGTQNKYALVSGKRYTVSFDFRDDQQTKVSSLEVGLATSEQWNGPTLVQPSITVPTGTSSDRFTTKSISFTAAQTGEFLFALRQNWANSVRHEINTQIKNIRICEDNSTNSSAKIHNSYTNYPNPFVDETTLVIEYEEKTSMKVIVSDISGRIVFEGNNLKTNEIINMGSDWPIGIYSVKAFFHDRITNFKLIKH